MSYAATIRKERHQFQDLGELLAKANELKSGDQLAGIAASSEQERVAAKLALADVRLSEFAASPLLDPDRDDVSRLIVESHQRPDRQIAFQEIASLTVGEFRERLLRDDLEAHDLRRWQPAILPEIAAAAAKLMSNKDLVLAASRIRNVSRLRNTLGESGTLAIRLQPNHPTDDLRGILLTALEGLLYGCGDACVGVNPANDAVESVYDILMSLDEMITRLGIPTQACCLAHFTTQIAAMERGAPLDLLFQSIAGTQAANTSFGVSLSALAEARQRVLEHHQQRNIPWVGRQVMYFETGQGSALSADAHHGLDQVTLEARAYGVAREFDPLLVNTVVGFIGPEYLADERQITRAGLEDHFMGKLLGLPMGCDVCYTNHVDADTNSADNLLMLLTAAGCNYFMGVPCTDDVMLNYQSTSYHDAAAMRGLFGKRAAPEFQVWLEEMGIVRGATLALGEEAPRRLLWEPLRERIETRK